MGNFFDKEPPPPMVLVPPLFDFPPLAARTRMVESSYNLLFGKLALKCLFEDYFEEAQHFRTMIMLKPIDDPHVDLVATVSGPLDHKPEKSIVGNAFFRWQRDIDDPHTFVDLYVSSSDPVLQMRSCFFDPKLGIGGFGVFPLLMRKRVSSQDYGVVGLRYGSRNFSFGATCMPFSLRDEFPKSAWLVSKVGRVIAGLQYEPDHGSKDSAKYQNLKNWSGAIGYGAGSGSPLSPSFNFCLELAKSSQVKNPLEESEVVGITNYIDFGFELQTSIDGEETSMMHDSTFQIGASWQANKNFLLKGKVGPLSSSGTCAFKSWWKPSFTLSISVTIDLDILAYKIHTTSQKSVSLKGDFILYWLISNGLEIATIKDYPAEMLSLVFFLFPQKIIKGILATRDHTVGNTAYGFGLRVEHLREASYQRADPNFVMLTPNKEHLAEGIVWKIGKRPMLESDVNAGNFDAVPRELRPLGNVL
ncbi:hypothetical protein F8388_021183 [Cannabis sativa]|uniref:Uncharacterized protein n=1 Tax=Cannabis sativa TaxID=3483 RepID=A0A7J6GF27_CANSA|nr:hypothetical protein F8388_021183 [Cannabis sativa]KAF4399930.1 hypothetical protein G4B88_021144 [Cannabis sativa]